MTSILTYWITKRFGRSRDAQFAALHLAACTEQAVGTFRVAKTAPREWTVEGFVSDTALSGSRADEIKHILNYGGTSYGTRTFTS